MGFHWQQTKIIINHRQRHTHFSDLFVLLTFRVLGDANGYDNWPTGRGIFFSNNKKFLVWVNEEDHLRIISMQQGGNLAEVWKRLVNVRNYL